jgi:hypothetical protein
MPKKKKSDRTARRALELFKDNRFAKRVVKSKKAYDRKRDRRVVNETESGTPVNAMGASSTSQGPIQTYDPLLQAGKQKLKKFSMFKRKPV